MPFSKSVVYDIALWRRSKYMWRNYGAVHGNLRHIEAEDEVPGARLCPIAHPFTPNILSALSLGFGDAVKGDSRPPFPCESSIVPSSPEYSSEPIKTAYTL